MNGTNRNGGACAGIPAAAMMPATYSPAAAYGAYTCPEMYEAEKCSMMCDVCDMLRDIRGIVTDTNKMVKHIHNKVCREAQTPAEADRK